MALIYGINIRPGANDLNDDHGEYVLREVYDEVDNRLQGKPSIGVLMATLIPVRTNNFLNFTADFFLPTTINQAMKVHNIAVKVVALIVALALDVVAFPIRFVTCIPRSIYNALQQEDPLHKFLRERGEASEVHSFYSPITHFEVIEADSVRMKLGVERRRELEDQESRSTFFKIGAPLEDGCWHYFSPQLEELVSRKETVVNFIEMPDTTLVQRVNEAIERCLSS